MSRKSMKRNIIVGMSALVLCGTLAFANDITSYASENTVAVSYANTGVQARSAIIEYRYKVVNGNLYRRLYNYTEQCWVGNWELCG